jgi:hypothetical protein
MPTLHNIPKADLKALQGIPMRIEGRSYIAVPVEVLQSLLARAAAVSGSGGPPPGSVEAGSYMRNLIASDLRAARAAAGLTQGQLATRMQLSQTRVDLAEGAARRVSLAFVKRWLAACGLPEDWKPQSEAPSRPTAG